MYKIIKLNHRLFWCPPPFPPSSDFLPQSSLLVCNNIFNFTGRPREEFLVFGEPESLQCDFRHSGQRSLITSLWRCLCVFICLHVCVGSSSVFLLMRVHQQTNPICSWGSDIGNASSATGMPDLLFFLSLFVISYCWDVSSGMSRSPQGPGCMSGIWKAKMWLAVWPSGYGVSLCTRQSSWQHPVSIHTRAEMISIC